MSNFSTIHDGKTYEAGFVAYPSPHLSVNVGGNVLNISLDDFGRAVVDYNFGREVDSRLVLPCQKEHAVDSGKASSTIWDAIHSASSAA